MNLKINQEIFIILIKTKRKRINEQFLSDLWDNSKLSAGKKRQIKSKKRVERDSVIDKCLNSGK